MMTRMSMILVCAFAVLAFATTALAQDDEAEVDWDEAIEFAEVTDTYVENGVKWETYYDELQNVMWSQPADATPEAVKAYVTGDQETLEDNGLDLCVILWPVPAFIAFIHSESSGEWDYLDPETYDATLTGSTTTTKTWTYYSYAWYEELDGAAGRVETSGNYCAYDDTDLSYELDDGTGWLDPESYNCWQSGSTYYISGADVTTVDDWAGVYGNDEAYVSRHRIYACDAYRYVYQKLNTIWIEK